MFLREISKPIDTSIWPHSLMKPNNAKPEEQDTIKMPVIEFAKVSGEIIFGSENEDDYEDDYCQVKE